MAPCTAAGTTFFPSTPLWAAPAALVFGFATQSNRLQLLITASDYLAAALFCAVLAASHLFGTGLFPTLLTLGGIVAAYLAVRCSDSRSFHYAITLLLRLCAPCSSPSSFRKFLGWAWADLLREIRLAPVKRLAQNDQIAHG